MKQNITGIQLKELSDEQADNLRLWSREGFREGHEFEPRNRYLYKMENKDSLFGLPLLSIGQLIEFLDDYSKERYWMADYVGDNLTLCDTLWDGVKEVLNDN